MTTTKAGPTPRQVAYLRRLRVELGEEAYQDALRAVFGAGWTGGADVPATVSTSQMSSVIGLLAATAGHVSRPRSSSRRRPYRRDTYRARCTHEDYPCCGC